jgi:CBS domain-containing protein
VGRPPPTTAGEIMTSVVFALPVSASVAQAAALMAYEGVQTLVITERDGHIAGVLSALDITRWCARTSGYLVEREEEVEAA